MTTATEVEAGGRSTLGPAAGVPAVTQPFGGLPSPWRQVGCALDHQRPRSARKQGTQSAVNRNCRR